MTSTLLVTTQSSGPPSKVPFCYYVSRLLTSGHISKISQIRLFLYTDREYKINYSTPQNQSDVLIALAKRNYDHVVHFAPHTKGKIPPIRSMTA